MRLYGKDKLVGLLGDMAEENRLPHAILLTGERGSGRRTMANFIAKLFLCGSQPCEKCSVCSKINSFAHPDVIYVLRECGGKYGLQNKGGIVSVREIMDGISVKPNDGDLKIYVFEDADELSPMVQNTLLKNIEEPEPWVKFIFLCESAGSLLSTVQSRVTEFRIPDCSEEDCCRCLTEEYGIERAKAWEYSQMMSGNIGKCLEALGAGTKQEPKSKSAAKKNARDDEQEDGIPPELKLMETARHAAAGIARKSGYMLCAALAEQSGRKEYSGTLEYLGGILRDALSVRTGTGLFSCGKKEAGELAGVYNEAELTAMLEAIFRVKAQAASANLNLALCSAYLTSVLI